MNNAETPVVEPVPKTHYLNLRAGQFDKTNSQDLRLLFDSFAQSANKDRLVVHFHGGLVSEGAGLETARRLLPVYGAAGSYPIFFVWQSQWYETLRNNVGDIFNEEIFQRLLKRILQFVVGKIDQQSGDRGLQLELPPESEVEDQLSGLQAGKSPFSDRNPHVLPPGAQLQATEEQQFRRALQADGRLREQAGAIAASPTATAIRSAGVVRASTKTLMDPGIVEEIRSDTDSAARALPVGTLRIIKGAVAVLAKTIKRFRNHRDHGLYETVFEEILREFYIGNGGQLVWSEMKKDTSRAFQSDPGLYGGTAFLAEVAERWRQGHHPEITLVGHSTGAIYICNLLQNAALLPREIQFGVVFLAPAADFDLLNYTFENCKDRIRGIRLFGMSEDLEHRDALIQQVPAIYPSSLLYFVSGVLEDQSDKPLVGMQRYYSNTGPYNGQEFSAIQSCAEYFANCPKPSLLWADCNGAPGFNCMAHSHTAFTHDSPTLQSVQQIIRSGF
jgi:hypothetical protein